MSKKQLDTEIHLIAFISLLSVLICSLLLTSVWVHIGSMDVKQSVGSASENSKKSKSYFLVNLKANGNLSVRLREAPKVSRKLRWAKFLANKDGTPNFESLQKHLEKVRGKIPEIQMALIQPQKKSVYENIIHLMDQFKKVGITDLGVSPL